MNVWVFAIAVILVVGAFGFAIGGFALYQKHKEEKRTV